MGDCVSSGNIWVWKYVLRYWWLITSCNRAINIYQKHMTPDRYSVFRRNEFTHPVPPCGRESRHLPITRCCRPSRHTSVLRSPLESYIGWKTIGNEKDIQWKGKEEFLIRPALLSSRSSPLTRRTGLSSSLRRHTNTSSPLDKPVLLKSH